MPSSASHWRSTSLPMSATFAGGIQPSPACDLARASGSTDAQVHVRMRRHLREDAVVVLRKPLRDDQRFAAALRGAEVVAVADRLAVEARDERDRDVVRLLHLRVQRSSSTPRRWSSSPARGAARRRRAAAAGRLMSGIAAVDDEPARQRVGRVRRNRLGPPLHAGRQCDGNDAVVAAAAQLRQLAVPRRRQVDLKVDRRRGRIDRGDAAHHLAILGNRKNRPFAVHGLRRRANQRGGRDSGAGRWQPDGGRRDRKPGK